MRGPIGSTFAGPHSVASAEIFEEGHQVIMVEIMSDMKERGGRGNANLGVSGAIPPSFTSPPETFHVRSVDISITPNKSMRCYTQ